ncbi:MAG: hypothetical protein UV32_C0018G0009 [Candidatus Collierbacteria bacterium GW2011_GWF2_42_51]|nr:MAG: hypothetical protein UV32_C0018G0009 [Candidatus Collierbacteria bacterium GW2011_GWF2_42_51]
MNKNDLKLKKYPGEKVEIRFFDSGRKEDMLRLRKIVDHREVQEMMDSVAGMSKKDRYEWADEKGAYGRYYLFAVSGTDKIFGEDQASEIGEVQGFVYLYAGSEEKKIINRIVRAGLIKKNEVNDNKIFEISFAKLPKAPGGQISSAVRQACLELVFVFCFIDESNIGSMRVVEACGFERRGRHFYEEDSKEMSALYVLDYKKLRDIEKKKING